MMKKTILSAALVVAMIIPSLSFAQLKQDLEPNHFSNVLTQPRGFVGLLGLDPNRFTMQHSYSLSFTSLGGQGFSQGVYLNTMGYQISDKMQVSMQWGMFNQPLGSMAPGLYENGFFLSGANFEYKPSKNFSLGIQYNNYPANYYYNPYDRHRYYRSSSPFRDDFDTFNNDSQNK